MNAIQEKRHVSDSFIIAEKVTFEVFFLVVKSCLRVWMPFTKKINLNRQSSISVSGSLYRK